MLAIAGVPLAQIRFARALARDGHDVSLVVGHIGQGFVVPEDVQSWLHILHVNRVARMFLPLVSLLRQARPDVIFSAEDHLNVIVCMAASVARIPARISCSSRVTPFDTYSNRWLTKRWWLKQMARIFLARATVLSCVSRDMVDQYRQIFPSSRHVCVYNIVVDASAAHRMAESVDHPWLGDPARPVIVAAGRLAPWKGFSDLIEAMKTVAPASSARLLILGDGPDRTALQAQISASRLDGRVQLVGYVDNALKYFARANVFALSSLVEGLPNVLVEAMMCGCTPVATDCPTGPREVLDGGRIGWLVPPQSPEKLATAILDALQHPVPREQLNAAVQPFSEELVVARHFELLGLSRRAVTAIAKS